MYDSGVPDREERKEHIPLYISSSDKKVYKSLFKLSNLYGRTGGKEGGAYPCIGSSYTRRHVHEFRARVMLLGQRLASKS